MSDDSTTRSSPASAHAGGAAGETGAEGLPAGVTLQALADRVYRMMVREARLERARGASGWTHRGG